MTSRDNIGSECKGISVYAAPQPVDGFWLARDISERLAEGTSENLIHIALDDRAMALTADVFALTLPDIELVLFPAWDCLPYDRVGPNPAIAARRIDALSRLAARQGEDGKSTVVLSTVNAVLQRVPPPEVFRDAAMEIATEAPFNRDHFAAFAADNGYSRVETVMEPGEYALRGGLVDVFAPGLAQPVRIDLFGDTVESIREFDALTQISMAQRAAITLRPMSEVLLSEDAIARFRSGYRSLFGAAKPGDALYESVSEGRRAAGMEHWLPLFYERLGTLLDYLPGARVSLAPGSETAIEERCDQIVDFHAARSGLIERGADGENDPYNALAPDALYLGEADLANALAAARVVRFEAFAAPAEGPDALDAGGRLMRNFAAETRTSGGNAFDSAAAFAGSRRDAGSRVVVACASRGSLIRIEKLLSEHGFGPLATVTTWDEVDAQAAGTTSLVRLDIEQGFTMPGLAVIAEPDILGQKLARAPRRARPEEALLAELTSLDTGDLVVHGDHGVGRYDGLVTVEVALGEGSGKTVPHDCMRLIYAGGDKLFVPVENLDVLSRYGEDQGTVTLDRLGGAAWQARKARLKGRIHDIAGELLKVAAARELTVARVMPRAPAGIEEFCARFPYEETEHQIAAIEDTLADLARSRPMDRLICGDVGFGKTEVALRAAFTAVMAGSQVAVVVPTTLLARQHFETFRNRFAGFPVEVAQLSRLVRAGDAATVKRRLAEGGIDIVIGTHALLAESVILKELGLLIIDEEQHFGVTHKERLKKMRADVHVLTLTATPIPRTLQLALAGVKDLSIIATPPVDRLAVRTFVLPFDPLVVGEAIRRELHRGGQCFYVCPHISDISTVKAQLAEIAPDARTVSVHGQMPAAKMEEVMAGFFDRAFDVLVSTNIIESGLDLPNVNTLIVHRADRFGLAQIYQLRGRVGRARLRAYAYLTLPSRHRVTPAAAKRLQVIQTLDSLGAGFSLASHDLDIRGAGNLLGDEQSGHIREVGIELYQHMLEDAVAELKGGAPIEADWAPQITIDVPVRIPETYVPDLGLRLGLYRRLSRLVGTEEIESFAAELIDRFGALPTEVENLMTVIALKQGCRAAGVEKAEAGPKGCLVAFRENRFANPEGLIAAISGSAGKMKVRPDQSLIIRGDWPRPADRIDGLKREIAALADLAAAIPAPAR